MDTKAASDILTYAEPILCAAGIVTIYARGLHRKFPYLLLFLAVRVASFIICLPLIRLARLVIEKHLAYQIYFYTFWLSYAVEAVVTFFIIYGVYKLAMEPLPGLQGLGKVMFRWAAAISIAVSVASAFGPHFTAIGYVIHLFQQLQQTQSVLSLCMLFFVCVTIKPMGLSWKSKIFGVNLGLGIMATAQLVQTAWFSSASSLYSLATTLTALAGCLSLSIWIVYMAVPEPKRRMIILPTTSPFFHWNQISQVLGDEPGFVAIGQVTEDMLDPTEVHMMRRAAVRMSEAY